MIPFELALSKALGQTSIIGMEYVDLLNVTGRILANDIFSDVNSPPFDKSAVDGFACKKSDIGTDLQIIETIPAGSLPQFTINPGQCSKIMTGAPVPIGADIVVMVEYSEMLTDSLVRLNPPNLSKNIARFAEDLKIGDLVLSKGKRIKSQDIAVLASVGVSNVPVYTKPKVCVYSTGNELVEPEQKPEASKIRNTNAYQIYSQVIEAGATVEYGGILTDEESNFLKVLQAEKPAFSTLIFTGSVSMGDFDLLPAALEKSGYEIIFKKIAIQPGKPTVFARKGESFVFGLPGNPVSSFVLFELLVKPFLMGFMGFKEKNTVFEFVLDSTIKRINAEREKWIPVIINEQGKVYPGTYHGSAHIHALSHSDGLICMKRGVYELEKGQKVHVRLI
jgi:molybdopterin molybdotransferase